MKAVRVTPIVFALLAPPSIVLESQSAGKVPVRLVVTVENATIFAGDNASLTVQLRDANNQTAAGRKDYQVYVEVRDRNTQVTHQPLLIRSGHDSQRLSIRFSSTGVFMIKASHPELREGAIFVNVKPRRTTFQIPGFRPVLWFPEVPQPPATATDQPLGAEDIEIFSSDEGSKLTANGRDAAVIQVFLRRVATFPVEIEFFVGSGKLDNNPLMIPAGYSDGQARFTSTTPTKAATIEVASVKPVGRVTPPIWKKSVQFFQPIKTALVSPSRSAITLADASEDVTVTLIGPDDTPVKPDEATNVTLSVKDGRGELTPSVLKFKPDDTDQVATFTPKHIGRSVITATPFAAEASDGICSEKHSCFVDISIPWTGLLATVIGGCLGGLGVFLQKKPTKTRMVVMRALLGILAALIFYWAVESGLLHTKPSILGNAVFAFIGSLLLGFLGTEGINRIWQVIPMVH